MFHIIKKVDDNAGDQVRATIQGFFQDPFKTVSSTVIAVTKNVIVFGYYLKKDITLSFVSKKFISLGSAEFSFALFSYGIDAILVFYLTQVLCI